MIFSRSSGIYFFCVFVIVLNGLLFSISVNAQSRWKPGYIVKAGSDTVIGQITYMHKHRSPKNIRFKRNEGDAVTIYRPEDIIMFQAQENGQSVYYHSIATELDFSETDISRINTSPKSEMVSRHIFAQLLLSGKKSVYFYQDDSTCKRHYLVEDSENKWSDLRNKRYYNSDDKSNLRYSQEYVKQILSFVADCPAIPVQSVFNCEFSEKKILALFKKYNNCRKPATKPGYEYKEEKVHVNMGAVAGGNYSSLKFSGDNGMLNALKFKYARGIDAGCFINLISPGTDRAWSLYNNIVFTQYDFKGQNSDPAAILESGFVRASFLKLFTLVRYQYPYSKIKPLAEIGLGNGYALNSASSGQYAAGYNAKTFGGNDAYLLQFRNYEQSYCLGIGACYNKFTAEFRLEKGNGMSSVNGISASTDYYHFLLSYSFR